jgi:hypothetical protein
VLPEKTSYEQFNESLRHRDAGGTRSARHANVTDVREKINPLQTLGMTSQPFRCVILLEPYRGAEGSTDAHLSAQSAGQESQDPWL